MKVFVAFDTGDQIVAEALVRVLREWFAGRMDIVFAPEFEFGDPWRDRLNKAIKGSDALVALCTPRSLENRWVHFEAGAFFGRRKRVIPVTAGGLKPGDLPEPLNTFQAPNLEVAGDMAKLAAEIAKMAGAEPPSNPEKAAEELRAMPETGLPKGGEAPLIRFWNSLQLTPNQRAREVLSRANYPYRIAIDDLVLLYASPGWEGHHKAAVRSTIEGRRTYDPEVARVAQEYQKTRPDGQDNKAKLALVRIDPFMTDRDHLGLTFEEMRYFDHDGPRRFLFKGDTPTEFALKHYLGKTIPEEIPTPITTVHTVLITGDKKHLVLGLRRKAAKMDYYENHLSVGFEEGMSPEDGDLWGTVKRGLREETGIAPVEDSSIELLAVGLEASFCSVALVCMASLDCTAEELHRSIQLNSRDHEWDPLFVPNDAEHLTRLLRLPLARWQDLSATTYSDFTSMSEYEWHGTSRFRLFAYLARRDGIGRLVKNV